MGPRVLVLGGQGRIGAQVVADVLAHTAAEVTVASRRATTGPAGHASSPPSAARLHSLRLDVTDASAIAAAIAQYDVVIHCAGPFRNRAPQVLLNCIEQGKPYLDVADSPDYVNKALALRAQAQAAGVSAIVGTGIFPGISNSMVRQGVEQFDRAESVHLSYLVAGSGGAGPTVMRTTFIELQTPFMAKLKGRWQAVSPYSQREVLDFPRFGKGGIYWFNTVEALTLADTFPEIGSVITKFGSVPDYYNRLTWLMARLPQRWLKTPLLIEALSQISYAMTRLSDPFTGIGIAIRLAIKGEKAGRPHRYLATFDHDNTAYCAGCGAGAIAQLLLTGRLSKPGVWTVEQALPTDLFLETLCQRQLEVVIQPEFNAHKASLNPNNCELENELE